MVTEMTAVYHTQEPGVGYDGLLYMMIPLVIG